MSSLIGMRLVVLKHVGSVLKHLDSVFEASTGGPLQVIACIKSCNVGSSLAGIT